MAAFAGGQHPDRRETLCWAHVLRFVSVQMKCVRASTGYRLSLEVSSTHPTGTQMLRYSSPTSPHIANSPPSKTTSFKSALEVCDLIHPSQDKAHWNPVKLRKHPVEYIRLLKHFQVGEDPNTPVPARSSENCNFGVRQRLRSIPGG